MFEQVNAHDSHAYVEHASTYVYVHVAIVRASGTKSKRERKDDEEGTGNRKTPEDRKGRIDRLEYFHRVQT